MVILKDAKGEKVYRSVAEVWQNDGMVGWEWGQEAASSHFILLFTFTNGEHEVSFLFFPLEANSAHRKLKLQ